MPTTQLKLSRTGYWELRYSEKTDTGLWRTRTVSTRETDRGKAESFKQVFEAQLNQAMSRAAGSTIADVLDEYAKKFKNRSSRDSVVKIIGYLRTAFGNLTPADLSNTLFADYGQKRGIGETTLRNHVLILNAAINHATKIRMLKADDRGIYDVPSAAPPRDLWLNETQEAEFYAMAVGDSLGKPRLTRVTRFVCIALDTGQRRAAIYALKWSQVDFGAKLIDFRMKRNTKKRQGIVPISDRLLPILERAYKERTNEYVLDHPSDSPKAYNTFTARIGYRWATAHVLRHTAATLMARAGVPLWDVAGVLGNSPAVVASVYAHHSPEHLRSAVNKRFA